MITKLTKEQETGIIEWRNHCLKIGRDTSPINKELTEKSWNKFYKILKFNEPQFWYCQSPFQAQIIINILQQKTNIRVNIRDNIWANIRENIRNNIRENIWANIEANIGENIRNNIRENIWANIWDNIRNNIGNNIWENIRDKKIKFISTYSFGQHDIAWIAYLKYFNKCGLLPHDENFEIYDTWYDLACACGWCYTFKNIVFVCEKPNELHLLPNGQLHKDRGLALKYSDGYGIYVLNGTRVPQYLAETPAEKLDIEFFTKEKNADIRTEFVRKFGIERMCHLGKTVDNWKNYNNEWWERSEYELFDMAPIFTSHKNAYFLKMKNLSTGTWHMEGVAPDCNTLEKALAFRMNNKHQTIVGIK